MKIRLLMLLSIAHFALVVPAKEERVVEDHRYPLTVQDGDETWALRGAGLYKYKGLVKVFTAALYETDDKPEEARRLLLTYSRKLDRDTFVKQSRRVLNDFYTAEQQKAFLDELAQIDAAYQDVKPGDQYLLEYQKGKGTRLLLNGTKILAIEDDQFGPFYFTIWLGEKPMSTSLRNSLLTPGGS